MPSADSSLFSEFVQAASHGDYDLKAMGDAARHLVESEYSWESIANLVLKAME